MAPQLGVVRPTLRPDLLVDEDGYPAPDPDLFAGDQEYDDLGFVRPPAGDSLGDRDREYTTWFEPKADRRRLRFEAARRSTRTPRDWTSSSYPQTRLKTLLRKGLPTEYRAEVWWSILGCEERRRSSAVGFDPSKAANLLQRKTLEEIERDLERTFPNHESFRKSSGRAQLRNVLRVFAVHFPHVQYCQGLNYIAAMLLIVFGDEEQAFWALVSAVDFLGVEHYYTDGMRLLRADMDVFEVVLQRKCPKVFQVIQQHDVQIKSFCTEWFVTWFAKALPVNTVLRVWDTLFFEGFKVLFRVGLGIFKRVEPEVRQCDSFEAVMERAKKWARGMVEHNELLKASFRGVPALRRADLSQARTSVLAKLEAEDERSRRLREERAAAARSQ